MPIAVAREAGPDVRALGDRLLNAAGFDIVEGAALADLLQGYAILILRGEAARQAQADPVRIPVTLEQLVPAGSGAGDRFAVDGECQLAPWVVGVPLEQAATVQHVVAVIAGLDGGRAFRESDQVQEPEHVGASGLSFGESGHGFSRRKKARVERALGGCERRQAADASGSGAGSAGSFALMETLAV